jgi:hypothetical protein
LVQDPFDLGDFDADAALPPCAALEVIDGNRLTANNEQALIGLAEPVIEGGYADTESDRCITRRESIQTDGPRLELYRLTWH